MEDKIYLNIKHTFFDRLADEENSKILRILEKSEEEKNRMRINENNEKLYEIADKRDELNRRISILETDFKYTKREEYKLLINNLKSEVFELTKDIENTEKEIDIDFEKIGKPFLTMIH